MLKSQTTIKKTTLPRAKGKRVLRLKCGTLAPAKNRAFLQAGNVPLAPADVTPGEILLEEFMKPLGLSGNALARLMAVDPMRVNDIVHGKRAITVETALRFAAVFETSPRFWLGLQNDHDLAVAARRKADAPPSSGLVAQPRTK
jgi:antitoxin HigA-1